MHVIGILGGVASGKSAVARLLSEAGAAVLDADRIGHEVLRLPEVERAARNRWGDAIFDAGGRIDRGRLASIVFAPAPDGPRERAVLQQLTHPRIAERIEREARRLAASGCPAAILDAPLLLEANWDKLCDRLVFVEAPRDVRLARALRRGWSPGEFAAREEAQAPVEQKRARADLVVENSGDLEETRQQVLRFWRDLPARDRGGHQESGAG